MHGLFNMKKFLLAMLLPLSVMANGNGPYPVPGGGNVGVTNGQPYLNFGVYSTIALQGFSTNSFDVINAFQFLQAIGHYAYSTPFACYTNASRTNTLLFLNANSNWEFGTNKTDNGTSAYYTYTGANSFPTNDPASWIPGNINTATTLANPASIGIGILVTSNTPINSYGPFGSTNTVLDQGGNTFQNFTDPYFGTISATYYEVSPFWNDTYHLDLSYPNYNYTNQQYNSANNYALAMNSWRVNGGGNYDGGDDRGFVGVSTMFGKLVITNGVYDGTHVGDLGSIIELLTKRNITNSTSVQSGTFMHPFKLYSDSHVSLGNNPESEHTGYFSVAGFVTIRESDATTPQLMLCKSPKYTGIATNGFLYSDGLWVHVFQNGSDQYGLSGATPNNGGSLTNTAQNIITYTNFLLGSSFTNTSTRNELVSVNARCNPTTIGSALFAIVTSPTGATYTTNSINGMEADTIYTTSPHGWSQATAQVSPGGIWKVVDITGGALVTITNSYYQTLQ